MNLHANSLNVNRIHVSHFSCSIKMFQKRRQDVGDRRCVVEDSGILGTFKRTVIILASGFNNNNIFRKSNE